MPVTETPLARSVFAKAPALRRQYHTYTDALTKLLDSGHVTEGDIRGKRILDWECGAGVYALLFAERGAAHCEAIDSWLWTDACRASMGHIPGIRFEKTSIEDYAADPARRESFDLIFANTVTEHMLHLPGQLPVVARLLKPGGMFITNHDNYYQPAGSHDHGFHFYSGNGSRIVQQGPRCWETPEKCATSQAHRAKTMKNLWWTWDAEMEKRLTPSDCTRCPYYKRSQPWAHLLYQDEFRTVFPQPGFTTGYQKSSLNKLTPFQVRQFVIEAGFDIAAWVCRKIANEPPPELLAPPFNFSRDDLQTCIITVVARKAFSPYGE